MAGVFNEDESTEDDIDVDFHLGERLRINRGENSNFAEDKMFKNSKDFKQYFNMRRKKFAQEGQSSSSSSVEIHNDNPTSAMNSSDNYHNKKRQNGDKTTEQLANPKRTCLNDRFPRSSEWRDYKKKINNHDSQSETSLFPDSFYLHRATSPKLFNDKKSEECVNNLTDAEDSDFEIPVKINRTNKIDNGHNSKNSKMQFSTSHKAQNFENKASSSCFNKFLDSGTDDESKSVTQNGALIGGRQESVDDHSYNQGFESKTARNFLNKFAVSCSEDESESVMQNGALKGGRQESTVDHTYSNKRKNCHKANRKVLDSDESETDDALAVYRSKPLIFSSSDSDDFGQTSTKNKYTSAASSSSTAPGHSYDGDFNESTGCHSKQFKSFRPNQKFSKKVFNSAASNKPPDSTSTDTRDRQFLSTDFQRKNVPHRSCKSRRNARINMPSTFTSNNFTKSSNISGPVRGRRISGGERGARRSGSPHHRSNRCQHKSEENKCRGRSVSVSRTQTEQPSYAARYPDVFDAEESENEFFTANSYSDTETSTESLGGLSVNTNFLNHTGSVSCTINCEDRHIEDSSDDEISVVFSTGPYGRNNEARRGASRTLGRRHSRGAPHRQLQNAREVVSLSPDPVEQVRQVLEDERMARMLQAQFDAEIDPDYMPVVNPTVMENDDSDEIIDPLGDSDTDERSLSSPERSISPFTLFSINRRGLGVNRFIPNQRSGTPTAIFLGSRRMDSQPRRRSYYPAPRRESLREHSENHYSRIFGFRLPDMAASILDDYEALLTLDLDDEAVPRGLPKSDINRLPTRQYVHPNSALSSSSSEVTHKRTELNKECQVCLTDYETGDVLRILPCFHEFHTPCIDPWLTINHTCPVCRVTVDLDA